MISWITQAVVVEKEEKVGFGDGTYGGSGDDGRVVLRSASGAAVGKTRTMMEKLRGCRPDELVDVLPGTCSWGDDVAE